MEGIRKKTPLGIVIITILTVISGLILLTMSFFLFFVLLPLGPVGLIGFRIFIYTRYRIHHCFNWTVQGKGLVVDIAISVIWIWRGRIFVEYCKWWTTFINHRYCYKFNNNILFV